MSTPDRPASYRPGTAEGLELLWNGRPLGPGRLLDDLDPKTVGYYLVLVAALLTILVTFVGNADAAHGQQETGSPRPAQEQVDQVVPPQLPPIP